MPRFIVNATVHGELIAEDLYRQTRQVVRVRGEGLDDGRGVDVLLEDLRGVLVQPVTGRAAAEWINAVESSVSFPAQLPHGRASGQRDTEGRGVQLDLLQVSGPKGHLQADCPLDDGQPMLDVRLEIA